MKARIETFVSLPASGCSEPLTRHLYRIELVLECNTRESKMLRLTRDRGAFISSMGFRRDIVSATKEGE